MRHYICLHAAIVSVCVLVPLPHALGIGLDC